MSAVELRDALVTFLEAGHETTTTALAWAFETAPLRLDGYHDRAGWYVSPFISLVHRDGAAFPSPDEFRPERFLPGGEAAAERSQRGWTPFGGGHRHRIGAQLALLEMKVITREVLRRVDLPATGPGPEAHRVEHVTRVIAHARTAATATTPTERPTS